MRRLATIALGLAISGLAAVAQQGTSSSTGLDYEYFKTKIQPIFLAKREGHARCVACHISGTPLRLQSLPAGSTTWSDEQSRKNFDAVQRVAAGSARSQLLLHPLAHGAGGAGVGGQKPPGGATSSREKTPRGHGASPPAARAASSCCIRSRRTR